MKEALFQPLYDYLRVDGERELQFFQRCIGMPPLVSWFETNMLCKGYLPSPLQFRATSIRVFYQTARPEDYGRVLSDGMLELEVGDRRLVRDGPLFKFPPIFPVPLDFCLPQSDERGYFDRLKEFSGLVRNALYEITPVTLDSYHAFGVHLRFRDPVAPGRLGVILDGYMLREPL